MAENQEQDDEATVNADSGEEEDVEVVAPPPKKKARKNDYRSIIVRFINFLDDTEYTKDDFTNGLITVERLNQLTPKDVLKWFNFLCFGVEDPGDKFGDMKPHMRKHSLEYFKKAISNYMPNRLFAWNAIINAGNPTRSKEVNDLIKYVAKKEARREGAPSQARRSITKEEFVRTIKILKENGTHRNMKYGIPALMVFQFHMIARVDDACMAMCENLHASNNFPFLLKARLSWSKNVLEERDAPWQFVLASMDSTFDVYIHLALWLEVYYKAYPPGAETPYLFSISTEDFTIPTGGEKSKDLVQRTLRDSVFNTQEFNAPQIGSNSLRRGAVSGGPLGSHSVRKFGSTHCRKNGCTKDEKDYCGRWKAGRRVSDVYDDRHHDYSDHYNV